MGSIERDATSGTFSSEGFAQPWVEFEKQIGQRLLIHGPTLQDLFTQYAEVGSILVSKLKFPAPDTSVTSIDKEIQPGLKVRIYTPPNYGGDKPACVFYHGGGWAMGDLKGEDHQVRTICRDAGIMIVSVDYRLAPQYRCPVPLEDCVAAYEWVLKSSEELRTTPGRVVTFGTSAGANLALSTALKIVDAGNGESLIGVVAVAPVTVIPSAVPEKWKGRYTSYEECAEKTINTKSAMDIFIAEYGGDPNDPYVSPLLHPRLRDLSRVYIAECGQDTLRDDARLLKTALEEASVPVLYDAYEGYSHFWWTFPSEHLAKPIAQFNANLANGFRFVLGQDSIL